MNLHAHALIPSTHHPNRPQVFVQQGYGLQQEGYRLQLEGYVLQREATGSGKKGYGRQPPPMKNKACHPERSGLLQRSEGPAASSREDHQRQEGSGLQREATGSSEKGYRRQPPPMKNKACHPERSGLLQRSEGPASSPREDHHRQEGCGLQSEGYGLQLKGTGFSPYIKPSPLEKGALAPAQPNRITAIVSSRHEVSGHDFSRADKTSQICRALAPAPRRNLTSLNS